MIIAFANSKGGAGKTTTALVSWAALPNSLAIDLDVQGNFTSAAGGDKDADNNIYTVMTGRCAVQDAIQHVSAGGLIPSSPDLINLTVANTALRDALRPVRKKYPYIILDTPPAINTVTANALSAADVVIIPVHADRFALEGVEQLADVIKVARQRINPGLKIAGLLLTRFSPRSNVRRQLQEAARNVAHRFGTQLFETTIRDSVKVTEAQLLSQNLLTYAPKSSVATDFLAFIDELQRRLNV